MTMAHDSRAQVRLDSTTHRLLSLPDSPFWACGSIRLAAKCLGWKFLGVERTRHYCQVAKRRVIGGLPT